MIITAIATQIELSQSGEPPAEFRLFRRGVNKSYKGDYTFSELSCASVLADYATHGAALPIDYCHAMRTAQLAPDPAKAGEAAGWFRPAVRNGELWATGVEWCDTAKAAIKARRYRYHSASFAVDDDRVITRLQSCALTNLPAIHGQEALLSQAAPVGLAACFVALQRELRAVRASGDLFLRMDVSGATPHATAELSQATAKPPAAAPLPAPDLWSIMRAHPNRTGTDDGAPLRGDEVGAAEHDPIARGLAARGDLRAVRARLQVVAQAWCDANMGPPNVNPIYGKSK